MRRKATHSLGLAPFGARANLSAQFGLSEVAHHA